MEKSITYFMAGMGLGIGITLLYAPKSGRDTRRIIARKTARGKDFMVRTGRDISESASDLYERGKETVIRVTDGLGDVVEAGKRRVMS